MNPALIVSILTALPSLLEEFQSLKTSGLITPEDQAKVKASLDALRATDFSGQEWAVTP